MKKTKTNKKTVPTKSKQEQIKSDQKICPLCHRNRPVYAGDEQLKRLPDRSLT
jgi:hypothetical protein